MPTRAHIPGPAAGAAVFALLAHRERTVLLAADVLSRTMRVRALFEVIAGLFCFLAVALTPLSCATAIRRTTPVWVVLGASLLFGERVGWRRWCAVGGATVISVLACAALMRSLRTGEITAFAPFRSTRIIFGVGAGVLLFDERLDPMMLLGCAVVSAAGLPVAWEGRPQRT